jgi:hypothetical protein
MPDQPLHTPAAAAKLIGQTSRGNTVNVHSLRRWCALHAEYLSPGANPNKSKGEDAPDAPRLLTDHDVEVLRTIAELRVIGTSTADINAKLATLSFAVVTHEDDKVDNPNHDNLTITPTQPPEKAQDAPDGGALLPAVVEGINTRIESIERRLEVQMEETRAVHRDRIAMFIWGAVLGMIGALILFTVAYLLVTTGP